VTDRVLTWGLLIIAALALLLAAVGTAGMKALAFGWLALP
jgi:hypothetical protein